MKKEKLYFRTVDSNHCYQLEKHLEDAKEEGLEHITLTEAVEDTDKDFIWCKAIKDTVEIVDCNKSCVDFSGKNKCRHKCIIMSFGKEYIFLTNDYETKEI